MIFFPCTILLRISLSSLPSDVRVTPKYLY
jgi:hypothetical protein